MKRTPRLLAWLLTLAMLLSLIPAVFAAEPPWADWTLTSSWSVSDAETLTCAGTDLGAAHFASYNIPLDTSSVSVSLRMDAAANAGNAKYGINILGSDGAEYYFFFASGNEGGYAAILKIQNGTETYLNTSGAYPSITIGQWTEFKVTYSASSASFYVGGNLLHTITGDYASAFNGGYFRVYSYGTPISLQQPSLVPEMWSYDANWTENNNVVSYGGTDAGAAHFASYHAPVDTNCISVDVRRDGAFGGNGNMGISLLTTTGDVYYFRVHADGYSSVNLYPAAGGEQWLNTNSAYPSVPENQWVNFKLIYDANGLDFYVGGNLCHHIDGDYATLFKGATLRGQSYYTPVSFKVCSVAYLADCQNWANWDYYAPAWTVNSDHSISYAGTDTGSAYTATYKNSLSSNHLDIAFRIDATANAGNGGLGLLLIAANGDKYYFTYNVGGYAAVIKYPAAGGETYLNTGSASPSVGLGQWTNLKLRLEDNYVDFYVGTTLAHHIEGDFAGIWENYTVQINDYAVPASFQIDSFEPIVEEVVPWADWSYASAWTMDGDVLSYTGFDTGAAYTVTYNSPVTTNCIDVDFRVDGTANAGNGGFGIIFRKDGVMYYFTYNVGGYAAVIKNENGVDTYLNTGSANPTISVGQWANFKVILEETYASFYIDGNLMHTVAGDFAGVWENGTVMLNDYAVPLSVRFNSMEPVEIEVDEVWGDWAYSSAWIRNEDDSLSYNGQDLGAAYQVTRNTPVDTNCVDVDIRVDSTPAANNGHIGLALLAADGNTYYFFVAPVDQYVAIQKIDPNGNATYINSSSVYTTVTQGEWMNFKVILQEDYIAFYIDGALMHLLYGNWGEVFSSVQPRLASYATPVTVRVNSLAPVDLGQIDTSFPSAWGYNENWTENDDGSLTYTGSEFMPQIAYNYPVSTNAIELMFRVEEDPPAMDANICLAVKCKDGNTYGFVYLTYQGYGGQGVRITWAAPGKSDGAWLTEAPKVTEPGQWHTMKVLLYPDVIAMYIDGDLVAYYYDDFGENKFDDATLRITTYNTKASLKVTSMEESGTTMFDYDFEFDSPKAVSHFTATNSELSHSGSSLVMNVTGENASVRTPVLLTAIGHKYSALAEVRNTVYLRLKNNTAATELKVKVITDTGETEVLVPVEPYSDDTTYFANYSRAGLTGYVRFVEISPVGVSEGSIEIDAIRFEKEKELVDYAGEVTSCLVDFETRIVTVTGTLKEEFAGQTVQIYDTPLSNVRSQLKGTVIAEAVADGTNFTVQFSLDEEGSKVSRLSCYFIAGVGDLTLGDRFIIENGDENMVNPYAFTLPDYVVDVTQAPYNAKGDAFTDDTAAIQAAIDAVSAAGGGTVLIPGEPENFYGRRYMITGVQLKSNVELHIEEGAVLWQNPLLSAYFYTPTYGHNEFFDPPIPWSNAAFAVNYPMISATSQENIRVTGGGEVRCADHGGESWDGVSGSNRNVNCPSLIHIFTVGYYDCKNVEISNMRLTRSGGYFLMSVGGENIYYANNQLMMPTCVEADCTSFSNTDGAIINHCFAYSNDDAVVLSSAVTDPRADMSPWFDMAPETWDHGARNITVAHSNYSGGKGLTFIAWGTSMEDLSQRQIENIHAYDSRFNTSASWYDSPYHGTPYFTSLEVDYSPVVGVRIENCWFNKTPYLLPIQATDMVTDFEFRSASDFQYGSFERNDPWEPDWVCGLSNWTTLSDGGTTEAVAEENGNHYGKVSGLATLAQGLYMKANRKEFALDAKLVSGSARMVVKDIITGEIVAELPVSGNSWTSYALPFTGTDSNLYLGIEALTEDTVVLIDNAVVNHLDGEDTGDPRYPVKDQLVVDQPKILVTLVDEDPSVAIYRNDVPGTPVINPKISLMDEWEYGFCVEPFTEDNRLRTFLSNSDEGMQILLDFWYHEDRQLMVGVQYKLSRYTWSEPVYEWFDVPEGSREYRVRVYHEHLVDYAVVEVRDYEGNLICKKNLDHKNFTCSTFYGTGNSVYGLFPLFFDWSENAKLSKIYGGAIGDNTEAYGVEDYGWDTDEFGGVKDFSGWGCAEGITVKGDYAKTTGNHRVWKNLIADEKNFTVSTDYTVSENGSAYIKVLGQTLELDARNGNGNQLGVKLNGQFQDWIDADGRNAKVYLTRENGGDIKVSILTQDNMLLSEFTMTPSESSVNVELGLYAGEATFANIEVTNPNGDVEADKTPGDFGWETDDNNFKGWKATDEANLSVSFASASNGRVYKGLLTDLDNFTIDLDVVNDNTSSTYIKVLGVNVELNSSGGDGNQTFMKVNGTNYDWLSGNGCKFHVNIVRVNGGDLTITVTGAGNANAFTATATPTESNENVELGLYRGISRFENITVVSESEPEGPIEAADLVFRNKTLSLQSYIAFNITARNSVLENYDSWYVVFERYDYLSGAVVTETVEGVPYSSSYQLFEYKVSSYMMSDSITATLYAVRDGVTYKGEVCTDSVENFVVSRMASAADSSADLATLYANLLTYGSKAQTFLSYNVEALADANLGEYASFVTATAPTAENLYAETSNGRTGATKNKLALGISSAVQIQLRINLDAAYDVNTVYGELTYTRGSETITQRIDGKDFTKSGSRYVLVFDAITAVDGRAPVQITIYDAEGNAISETWTYSISSYLVDGGLTGNGLATMEALLNYFDSAAKVFG